MSKFVCLITLIFLLPPALADGVDRYAFTLTASEAENSAAMIRMLNAGALASVYIPSALIKRGARAYYHGRCKSAKTDAEAVLTLMPDNPGGYALRGMARACLGSDAAALADFKKVQALEPRFSPYRWLARIEWRHGRFTQAAQTYQLAETEAQSGAQKLYMQIRAMISAARAGSAQLPSPSRSRETAWPAPVLTFYRGDIRLAALEKMATNSGRPCETDFYVGEWQISHHQPAAGWQHVSKAARECPADYIETDFAKAELARRK